MTIKKALKYLGIKDNKGVKIKLPIEEVSIYKSHMEHLINDNNAHRKKYLNRVIRTIQEPNLITKSGNYHNYIKLFSGGKNTKPHLQIVNVKDDEKILKDFSNKYTEKDLENNPELVKTYVEAYNRYNKADLEVDADNVGLALQSYMGGSKNRQIKNYTRDFLANEKLAQATSNDKTLGAIRAFI